MGGSSSKPKLVTEDEKNWDRKTHTTNISTASEDDVSWFKDKLSCICAIRKMSLCLLMCLTDIT
jgi:hypothetical protein